MQTFFFEQALLPDGWARNVRVQVDGPGIITALDSNAKADAAHYLKGPVIPGMPNLHSHAFQRAMAGLTEWRKRHGSDSFWSWRQQMYRFTGRITPEQLRIIASQLYIEMLKAGYTAVGEFHYLHHTPEGQPYRNRAQMSQAIIAAARLSGIGLTLLPVLYVSGGFNGKPANTAQQRFVHSADQYLALIQQLTADHGPLLNTGIAPHSLRAVPASTLKTVVNAFLQLNAHGPIHIHIAEQQKEVNDCLAHTGQRPVAWLLTELPVDAHWCLVHATHMTEDECTALARSGAVAGLCPTTEANLGDGFFSLPLYIHHKGVFGIGSDSNSHVNAIDELRWLEYGQRLLHQSRNISATATEPHVGQFLWQQAAEGGARALGQATGRLAVGYRADWLVLSQQCALTSYSPQYYLDSLLFSSSNNRICDVFVAGKHIIRDGHHREQEKTGAQFAAVMKTLLQW